MKKLFTVIFLGTFLSLAQATEVSTECLAMNQERSNPKAEIQNVKVNQPTKSGATKQ